MRTKRRIRKNKKTRRQRKYKKIQKGGQACPIHYFTISTKTSEGLTRLQDSAKKFGWDLKVLGLEMNDDSFGWQTGNTENKNYGEFSWKLDYQKKYVNTFNDNAILLFTDAWDVIVIGTCDEMYKRYLKFNK